MISNLNIRDASVKDIDHIYRLEQLIFDKSPWTKNMIKSEMNIYDEKKTFLIENNYNIIGYLMIHFFQIEYNIVNFGIQKEYQSKGIGEYFLNFFLNKIPKNSSVFLEVNESNLIAIKLYEKLGFVKQYTRKRYYADGGNAINLYYKKK